MPIRKGVGVSHGIRAGRALVIGRWEGEVPHYRVPEAEIRAEIRRFWRARVQAREEITALRNRTAETLGDKYAAIFDAHLLILDDRKLGRETMARIKTEALNAEWALAKTVQRILKAFEKVEDPYLRERGGDISDVHQRLQRVLAAEGNRHEKELELTEDTVVVAHALLPSDAVWLHQPRIVGFVTEEGGRTSHTAILANALEIPAVLGVDGITEQVEAGDEVVVDGFHGKVVLRPTRELKRIFLDEGEALRRIEESFEAEGGPVLTTDGVALTVQGNVEFPEEMKTLGRVGAQGVGLYRSEFLFLSTSPKLPTEEDHYAAYRRIAEASGDDPVVIRTLDLGGEKYFHTVLTKGEANPVLGLRAVRFCLTRPDIFRTQLRGLLRAAAEMKNIWIMVPMISGVAEWRRVLAFFDEVKDELKDEGLPVPDVPLGPMIEVPSAALVVDQLAREAEFLSIGTNDLAQYTLAVDRGNKAVSYLNDPWHPAVLRLIRETVVAGRREGIPVSLCGEMASDPFGALSLLGMGLRRFSCNPVNVSEVRRLLRNVSEEECRQVMQDAFSLATGPEIRAAVEAAFGERVREALGPGFADECGHLPDEESEPA